MPLNYVLNVYMLLINAKQLMNNIYFSLELHFKLKLKVTGNMSRVKIEQPWPYSKPPLYFAEL